MSLALVFNDGNIEELDSSEELVERLKHNGAYGWVDLTVDETDLLNDLAGKLDLHELAVEDALSTHERPKLARFSRHSLLTLSATTVTDDNHVHLQRCTAFLLPKIMITVRDDNFPVKKLLERVGSNSDLSKFGVAFLVWCLLDMVVDDHAVTLEKLDEASEELSTTLFDDTRDTLQVQQEAFRIRRSLVRMQHVTLPLREVVNTLLRHSPGLDTKGLELYFSDVYDHTIHSAEWADSVRDHITTVLETNVALQGNRMNATMKQVTSWAAIIAVPTAITGYFGQNLEFPGFNTAEAWWVSNGIILITSFSLFLVFKKRDWL